MEIPDIPNDLTVPNYLPLTLETTKSLGLMVSSRDDAITKLDQSLTRIKADVDDYIEFILKENLFEDIEVTKNVMASNLASVAQMLHLKYQLEQWKLITNQVKNQFNATMISESELHVTNLAFFQSSQQLPFNTLIQQQFADVMLSPTRDKEVQKYLNDHDLYQYIKNVAFIIENPTNPLPDEGDGDEGDDIAMAGGLISIKDPISLDYFKQPYKSRRCNHVYEKQHILKHLGDNTKTCPVNGCECRINKLDLKFDELMLLRVKVDEAKKLAHDHQADLGEEISIDDLDDDP